MGELVQTLAGGGSTLTDLEANVLVAVVGAILGGLITLLINYISSRKDPQKRISWDSTTEPGLGAIDPEIRKKLSISYNGTTVDNLYSVRYKVQNTGNHVIKDHRIRFAFPDGTRIVESRLSPEPEPELRVSLVPGTTPHEQSYAIGHLERDQEVQFRFVVSGKSAASWKAVHSNDEGDVDVEQRGAERAREDATHIVPFLIWAFMLVTVPTVLNESGLFVELLSGVLAAFFFLFALYHLYFVARVIRDAIARVGTRRQNSEFHIHAYEGGNALVVAEDGRIDGAITFNPKASAAKRV